MIEIPALVPEVLTTDGDAVLSAEAGEGTAFLTVTRTRYVDTGRQEFVKCDDGSLALRVEQKSQDYVSRIPMTPEGALELAEALKIVAEYAKRGKA